VSRLRRDRHCVTYADPDRTRSKEKRVKAIVQDSYGSADVLELRDIGIAHDESLRPEYFFKKMWLLEDRRCFDLP